MKCSRKKLYKTSHICDINARNTAYLILYLEFLEPLKHVQNFSLKYSRAQVYLKFINNGESVAR